MFRGQIWRSWAPEPFLPASCRSPSPAASLRHVVNWQWPKPANLRILSAALAGPGFRRSAVGTQRENVHAECPIIPSELVSQPAVGFRRLANSAFYQVPAILIGTAGEHQLLFPRQPVRIPDNPEYRFTRALLLFGSADGLHGYSRLSGTRHTFLPVPGFLSLVRIVNGG